MRDGGNGWEGLGASSEREEGRSWSWSESVLRSVTLEFGSFRLGSEVEHPRLGFSCWEERKGRYGSWDGRTSVGGGSRSGSGFEGERRARGGGVGVGRDRSSRTRGGSRVASTNGHRAGCSRHDSVRVGGGGSRCDEGGRFDDSNVNCERKNQREEEESDALEFRRAKEGRKREGRKSQKNSRLLVIANASIISVGVLAASSQTLMIAAPSEVAAPCPTPSPSPITTGGNSAQNLSSFSCTDRWNLA